MTHDPNSPDRSTTRTLRERWVYRLVLAAAVLVALVMIFNDHSLVVYAGSILSLLVAITAAVVALAPRLGQPVKTKRDDDEPPTEVYPQ